MKTKLFFVSLFVCTSGLMAQYKTDSITDSRDGQTYKIIELGDSWWMAENLNFETPNGSWCYDDNAGKCEKWGKLYTWDAAQNACPSGWHLATDEEWNELELLYGMKSKETSTIGWRLDQNLGKKIRACNGFKVVNAGYRPYGDGAFDDGNDDAYFWTATSFDDVDAWKRYFSCNKIGRGYDSKRKGFSVRCVKD